MLRRRSRAGSHLSKLVATPVVYRHFLQLCQISKESETVNGKRIDLTWNDSSPYLCFVYRYPTFIDAIRDLDDCLSMTFLFATFPQTKKTHYESIHLCQRLAGK